MKFKLIIILLGTILISSYSQMITNQNQNIIGFVEYKIGKYEIGEQSNKINPNLDKTTINKVNQEFESLTYNLFFSKDESLYEIQDKIESEKSDDFEVKFAKIMAGGLCYKNNISKEKIEQIESFNQAFNVVKAYDEYKWKISNETKLINGFKCYKATAVKEEYDEIRKINRRFTPSVWFTPEIPVSFGPKGLDGLPGLVLEATFNGKLFYYATIINLDYKEIKIIEKPKKGKYVSEKEFYEIDAENFKKNTE
ncbi:MAG: GLPGLI family protein [Flavobacterium sp.]